MDCPDCICKTCIKLSCVCWDRHLKAARVAARLDNSRVVDRAGYHGVVRKDK